MKNLFNLDNPFIQFLSRVGDLIILNFLFLVCSIPVLTIGASATALQKTTQAILYDEDNGTLKTFFRAFRENFRQATVVWVLMLIFAVSAAFNYLIVSGLTAGVLSVVLKWVMAVLCAVVVILGVYIFPLIARYRNTLREHATNSLILAVVKLPRTIALVGLALMPVIIAVISIQTFLTTLVFWLAVGFGFTSYMSSMLLKPVFAELEDTTGKGVQIMK